MKVKIPKFFTKKSESAPTDKKSSKWQRAIKFIVFLVIIIVLLTSAYGVWSFFDTYKLQTPIIIQSPIVPRRVNVNVVPIKGKTSGAVFNLGKIADVIYQKESSGGRNDGCTKLTPPMFNGYGFGQNEKTWNCYGSREEVRKLVISWLEEHIKNGDIAEALCYYNLGVHTGSCAYTLALDNNVK